MEKMIELTGKDPDIGAREFFMWTSEEEAQHLDNIFSGWVQSEFSGARHTFDWPEYFGYDVLDMSREVWVQKPSWSDSSLVPFSVMEGDFNKENIVDKLEALGYQLQEHASFEYYSIHEDYSVGGRDAPEVFRKALGYMNRVMVTDREIIAAPADAILFNVLDVCSVEESALDESPAYTRVAEALGDVSGAGLIPRSILRSLNVDAEWGTLHQYDLVGLGYIYGEKDPKLVIVLYYPDDSAADDIDELNRRMAEYVVAAGHLDTPLSELFGIGEPEAISNGPGSILKVELTFRTDTRREIWKVMVQFEDLGFLVADQSE